MYVVPPMLEVRRWLLGDALATLELFLHVRMNEEAVEHRPVNGWVVDAKSVYH